MTERVTIDSNLHFRNLVNGKRVEIPEIVIVELKRDSHQPSPLLPAMNKLRIFTMGFSKYCIGMALTDSTLKQNCLKERLHVIDKISIQ